jgi:hypothetical protein
MVRLTKEQKEANMIEFVKDIEKFLPDENIDITVGVHREWIDGDSEWIVYRTPEQEQRLIDFSIHQHNRKYVEANIKKNTLKERRKISLRKHCWVSPLRTRSLEQLTKKQLEVFKTTGYVIVDKKFVLTKDWCFWITIIKLPEEETNPYEYVLK